MEVLSRFAYPNRSYCREEREELSFAVGSSKSPSQNTLASSCYANPIFSILYTFYISTATHILCATAQNLDTRTAKCISAFSTFQGQFGYGGADDLWVNGGVPFSTGAPPTTTHNNNAYYVQVSI